MTEPAQAVGAPEATFTVDRPGPGRVLAEVPPVVDAGLPPATAPEGAPVDRLAARLKVLAERNQKSPVFEYPVPGWDGLLWVRYATLDEEVVARVRAESLAVETRLVDFYATLLVEHCRAVLIRDDTGKLVSADLSAPDRPAPRYDDRLARSLKWDYSTADDLVVRLHRTTGYVGSAYEALEADCGFSRAQEIRATRGNA